MKGVYQSIRMAEVYLPLNDGIQLHANPVLREGVWSSMSMFQTLAFGKRPDLIS